ncbi:MAG: hypothetical protein FJY80_11715 [Candidatus Aminicenantes bacterium]|nr:hypothetical protein [Candidatus Aminicenantes bacterium]
MKHQRTTAIIAAILLAETIAWVVCTSFSMSQVKPSWGDIDYLRWVAAPDIFFLLNYINATLLTITVPPLFILLWSAQKEDHPLPSAAGLIFIPAYALLNIACYSIQIGLVPAIAARSLDSPDMQRWAIQLVQARSDTVVGYLNGLAYGILGIPSIIYGCLMIRGTCRVSGFFLLANGIACIVGIAGYTMNNAILGRGILAGGLLFLVALVFMIIESMKAGRSAG